MILGGCTRMKKCPYCGKEYPDDVSVCVVDQTLLNSSGSLLSIPPPEAEVLDSQSRSKNYFIVPAILWGYIFSVILAKGFWSDVFESLFGMSHWTLTQQLRFLIVLNLVVAGIGAPQVSTFISRLKRQEMMSVSQHVGSSLCISAASLCIAAIIVCFVFLARQP